MATETFHVKKNDTSPSLTATLRDADGDLVDLTSATVRFHMQKRDGTVVTDAAATVASNDGIVRYDWAAADTDEAGTFEAEFEVTYADTTIETFPNTGFIRVRILEDIA